MRGRRAAGLGVVVLTLGGCASSGPAGPPRTAPEPAPGGSGYFVGTGPGGIGASLDLLADDPVVQILDTALRAQDGRVGTVASVGVASVVNEGPFETATPRFVAELAGGGAVPLPRAADVLRARDGPAARRALERLRSVATRVPGKGAVTTYVVLEGLSPAAVESVRMVVVAGESITLTARRR